MISKIISSELREQAGSDSYNRFEYQVYWIVYHMIKNAQDNKEFIVFCEYHDDMAEYVGEGEPDSLSFYQVKTNKRKKTWSLSDLFKVGKKEHSFLGYLFYNFKAFNDECFHCNFISNIEMDTELKSWKALIDDNKSVKECDFDLYNKIKEHMKAEFTEMSKDDFDIIFDKFIQKTFIYYGDLPIARYEDIVKSEFMNYLDKSDIYIGTGITILNDIVEKVRKISKCSINPPVSYKELTEKKSITSKCFKEIKEKIEEQKSIDEMCKDIEECLKEEGKNSFYCRSITRTLKRHHAKMIDTGEYLYQDVSKDIDDIITAILSTLSVDDIGKCLEEIYEKCSEILSKYNDIGINKKLLEAITYEKMLQL